MAFAYAFAMLRAMLAVKPPSERPKCFLRTFNRARKRARRHREVKVKAEY